MFAGNQRNEFAMERDSGGERRTLFDVGVHKTVIVSLPHEVTGGKERKSSSIDLIRTFDFRPSIVLNPKVAERFPAVSRCGDPGPFPSLIKHLSSSRCVAFGAGFELAKQVVKASLNHSMPDASYHVFVIWVKVEDAFGYSGAVLGPLASSRWNARA